MEFICAIYKRENRTESACDCVFVLEILCVEVPCGLYSCPKFIRSAYL